MNVSNTPGYCASPLTIGRLQVNLIFIVTIVVIMLLPK